AQSEAAESGWLRALADPEIGTALALIHHQPEARWTVGSLARRVAMSRSSFASKFDTLLGEAPLHYITRCRLNKAARLPRTTDAKVAEIAQLVGYESEAAFSKAFKRLFQIGPGEFRRSAGMNTGGRPAGSTAELGADRRNESCLGTARRQRLRIGA